MDEPVSTFGARWIVPVSRPPLENASLVVSRGVIVDIVAGGRATASSDLGEVALLPQLVNAHTHLEFSSLDQPIGTRGMSITDWIPLVVRHRQERYGGTNVMEEAIGRGINELLSTGTCAAGEIATFPWFGNHRLGSDLVIAGYVERLGNRAEAAGSIVEEAATWLDSLERGRSSEHSKDPMLWQRAGLSPHAPYSVSDLLFEQLIDVAVKRRLPVAMHLAESREELEWVAARTGPFREMLESLGGVPGKSRYRSMEDYLLALAQCPSSLIVHGNYLNDGELDLIAANRDRMHLVWCPRTHDWFGHSAWPLKKCLERNIGIGIGTDSRASNPDLNMWSELQFAAGTRCDISPDVFLRMATLGSAMCLGLDQRFGSLDKNKAALWLEVPLAEATAEDVVEKIVCSGVRPQKQRRILTG